VPKVATLYERFGSARRLGLDSIRGEAFNVTNTPIFADPNVTVGSTSFGVITGTQNSPRTLQIALKLNF
jgi:hypothetical protein